MARISSVDIGSPARRRSARSTASFLVVRPYRCMTVSTAGRRCRCSYAPWGDRTPDWCMASGLETIDPNGGTGIDRPTSLGDEGIPHAPSTALLRPPVSWSPPVFVAPVSPAVRRRRQPLRQPHERHHREAARLREARRRPRAPGRPAGHRGRQRRHPRLRHCRLRRLGRLRGRRLRGRRLRRRPCSRSTFFASIRLGPSALQQTAPGAVTYVELTSTSRPMDQSDAGDVTASRDGRRPAAGAGQHVDQRMRGRRLRRLPGGQHRPHPARHLHLRAEGRERRGRRCRGRQSSSTRATTADPHRPDRRHAGRRQHRRHPGAGRHLRPGRRARGHARSR